ncbi:MAG TPA: peptide chain release factor 2 [Candidatus Saccharimonadales bacterium]|jgi:peptide chain release factor 2|nr:peptide chain release factor 2 [Candidatus Saccharimonadales bacterium]
MDNIRQQVLGLKKELTIALERINFSQLEDQQADLSKQIAKPDFWINNSKASSITQQQSKIAGRLAPWQALQTAVDELLELSQLPDSDLLPDIEYQLQATSQKFDLLKDELKFSGKFDEYDAIVSIYAGAGGTDAQDWAAMLLRMYTRWSEQENNIITTIDNSPGDETGLKSITIEISGSTVYGKLKSEHGVHRLVRLSPFNADHLRQTSFAKVDVLPKIDKPEELAIDSKDLKIDVYRSGGHGGQSVNTTDSAVRVTHIPSGITVSIQNERSQLQNKETAMTILRSKLAQQQLEQHKQHLGEIKGPVQSAEWGNQIRSYVLHPYKQVKDLRTNYETSDISGVLDGNINPLINAYLEYILKI